MREAAQYDSQAQSTISTNISLRSMKYHEEDTTNTREVTKIITVRIKMDIMVRRIGTKTPRVPTRRRMTRKNPRTRMSILH